MKRLLTLFILAPLLAFGQGQVPAGTSLARIGYGGQLIGSVIGATGLAAEPTPNTLTNDLLVYYSLENDGAWTNQLGTYQLSENGIVTATNGFQNNAAYFNGVGITNYLYYNDNIAFTSTNTSFTFCGWVKLLSTNASAGIISKHDGNLPYEWGLGYRSDYNTFVTVFYPNGTNAVYANGSPTSIALGEWYFVVGKIDQTNQTHSVRFGTTNTLGAWANSATWTTGTGKDGPSRLMIGKYFSNYPWTGTIDEVALWTRLLTDTEITNLWNNGAGKVWPLD